MIIYIHIERPTQDICSRIAGEETDRISQIFLQNDTWYHLLKQFIMQIDSEAHFISSQFILPFGIK